MQIPDLVNGLFEAAGGIAVFGHVQAILRDKIAKGFSPLATLFFTSWGFWNLYYYPHLAQWFSFLGGLVIVTGNFLWIALTIKYGGWKVLRG